MNNGEAKKFHDVVHPGRTAANASSKPVIVSNRPMLKDPMVRDPEDVLEYEPKENRSTSNHQTVIVAANNDIDLGDDKISPERAEESSDSVTPTTATSDDHQSSFQSDSSAKTVGVPGPISAVDGQEVHDQTVRNLVQEETYFVHIGKPNRSRKVLLIATPFMLVLSAAVGYFLYMTMAK